MLRLSPLLLLACTGGTPDPDLPDRLDPNDPPCDSPPTWFEDHDEDGYGDPLSSKEACEEPVGYVADASDCDDDDPGTFPGAIEVCDGVDRDCDGTIDGDNSVDADPWHPDADGDGYGDAATTVYACERPEGMSRDARDCNDDDDSIHPRADDPACDGIDQDCGGVLEVEAAQIGGSVFAELAAAIDAASPGDVVYACPGVHSVEARIEADLSIVGVAEDRSLVVLDGGDARRLLDVDTDTLHLQNLTLRGGAATEEGGALRARLRVLTVDQVSFLANHATTDGGAVWLRLDGDAIEASFTDVVFEGNRAEGDGGAMAVHLAQSDFVGIDGAVFRDNHAGGNGGGIRLTGAENTAVLSARNVTARDHSAGVDGGWLSTRSFQHAIIRMTHIDVQDGVAGGRGGLIATHAPRDAKLDVTDGVLANGEAGDVGGLVAHRGDFTLDVRLHRSELQTGTAPIGGLVWVYTGGTGHLDWIDSSLHHGDATAGSALFLTGESTGFDGKIAKTIIRDNSGDAALVVDPDIALGGTAGFDINGGSIVDNPSGGIAAPAGFGVETVSTDLGSGSTDNGGFDIRHGSRSYAWEGVVSVVCADEVCESSE